MEDYRVLSAEEYSELKKIRQKPHNKPHVGKNQLMLISFLNGKEDHAVIECGTYRAAVIRRNSIEATIARMDLPIKVHQRKEIVLLAKL